MSNNFKYPKFLWIIVGIILILIVVYAVFSNQRVTKLKFPGGEVQFEQSQPKDETIGFAVIHDISHESLPMRILTTIYIDGKVSAKLSVGPNKRIAISRISVPKPGSYSYALEQDVQLLFSDSENNELYSSNKYQIGGRGKIKVKTGDAFVIVLPDFYPSGKRMPILRSLDEDQKEREKIENMKLEWLVEMFEARRHLNDRLSNQK